MNLHIANFLLQVVNRSSMYKAFISKPFFENHFTYLLPKIFLSIGLLLFFLTALAQDEGKGSQDYPSSIE
jgi:hypothetical protein